MEEEDEEEDGEEEDDRVVGALCSSLLFLESPLVRSLFCWVSFSCHTAPINTHTDSGASLDLRVPCAVILADAVTLQPTQKWQLECAQSNFSNEIYAAPSPLPLHPSPSLPGPLPVSSAYVQINLIANKLPGAGKSRVKKEK